MDHPLDHPLAVDEGEWESDEADASPSGGPSQTSARVAVPSTGAAQTRPPRTREDAEDAAEADNADTEAEDSRRSLYRSRSISRGSGPVELSAEEFVEAAFDMFLRELCACYELDGAAFRAFLVRRVVARRAGAAARFFDPEEWVARFCRDEALRRPASRFKRPTSSKNGGRAAANKTCRRKGETSAAYGGGAGRTRGPQDDQRDEPNNGDDDDDDDAAFEGWLVKKGRINRAWRRRFFRLDESPPGGAARGCSVLRYAVDEASPQRGALALGDGCAVHEAFDTASEARRIDLGFQVVTPRRTFYIKAHDDLHHKAWVAKLRCAINRVQPAGEAS